MDTIPKMPFGKTGHMSTRTIFGSVCLWQASQREADNILDLLFEYGLNHIDTAPSYGDAELRLGPWMKQHRDRFFLGRLFTVGVGLEQIGQDTLFTWQSAGIEAGRPAGRIGGNLVGLSATLNADRNVFSSGPLLRSWRFRFGAGLSLVRGDHLKRSFADVRTGFTVARKKSYGRDTGDTQSINQYILEFDGEGSLGLQRSLAFFLELVYKGLESVEDLVPISEQYYVGGARTLRGYRENQFHGRRVAIARAELRIGGSLQENLYVFVDNGYILQETIAGREDLFKTGYGFGLRTRSQVGVVGLSFGLGEEVSLGQAKVHILLEQNF